MDTWLLWKLTGGEVHATDYSNASSTGIYDTFCLGWSSLLFNITGLPVSIFPEVRDTSGDFGVTEAQLFGAEIPIRALVADQQSALFGECCFDAGDTKVTIGTGCFVDCNTGSKIVSSAGLLPMVAWKIGDEVTYMVEGLIASVGNVIDWGAHELGLYDHPPETEDMALSVADTNDVYFIPAFNGLNSPHLDPAARGTLIGISFSTKKEHIVRAILESAGYRCREVFDTIKAVLPSFEQSSTVRVDGGVSQNNFVDQFLADITDHSFDRVHDPARITALGAAFLAGLGAGVWTSKKQLTSLRQVGRIFNPVMDDETRARKYARWKKAISRSLKWADE